MQNILEWKDILFILLGVIAYLLQEKVSFVNKKLEELEKDLKLFKVQHDFEIKNFQEISNQKFSKVYEEINSSKFDIIEKMNDDKIELVSKLNQMSETLIRHSKK